MPDPSALDQARAVKFCCCYFRIPQWCYRIQSLTHKKHRVTGLPSKGAVVPPCLKIFNVSILNLEL